MPIVISCPRSLLEAAVAINKLLYAVRAVPSGFYIWVMPIQHSSLLRAAV